MMSPATRILVIEDDPQTRRVLRMNLSTQGFEILEASNGQDGLKLVTDENPDVTLLDLGLPDMDGAAVMSQIRQLSSCYVLILSARSQEADKIKALDAGADDYLTKPFGTGELEARIRALLRRAKHDAQARELFRTGELSVDFATHQVSVGDRAIHLTPLEFRILQTLIRHAGSVVTQRQLLRDVWGPSHATSNHYLRIYMSQLRHKLESDPARPSYLLTELGVGYRLALKEATP